MNKKHPIKISYLTLTLIFGINLTGCASHSKTSESTTLAPSYNTATSEYPYDMAESVTNNALCPSSDLDGINTESYKSIIENTFIKTTDETIST